MLDQATELDQRWLDRFLIEFGSQLTDGLRIPTSQLPPEIAENVKRFGSSQLIEAPGRSKFVLQYDSGNKQQPESFMVVDLAKHEGKYRKWEEVHNRFGE